jgi:hypothetical protein
MPINREYRDRIADAVESYLRCEIDNYALDEVLSSVKTDDTTCQRIAEQMWYLYDDCKRHRNEGKLKVQSRDKEAIERWLILLRSDSESVSMDEPDSSKSGLIATIAKWIVGRPPAFRNNEFWPWRTEADWREWWQKQSQLTYQVQSSRKVPP